MSCEWDVIHQRNRIVRCMPNELDLSSPSGDRICEWGKGGGGELCSVGRRRKVTI